MLCSGLYIYHENNFLERNMPLRQIEILVPKERVEQILAVVKEHQEDAPCWTSPVGDGFISVRVVLDAESLEGLTDRIEELYHLHENERILVWGIEAVIPRLIEEKDSKKEEIEAKEKDNSRRIAREEIYSQLYDQARPTRNMFIMLVLSALVAAFGLLRDDVAVIIGAMVIAPMLGPHVALAMATTLGDGPLARKAIVTAFTGAIAVFCIAAFIGLFVSPDPNSGSFLLRSSVQLGDLALALVAGIAGTLSYSMGQSSGVVGVMVAVALVPPLTASGLLVGAGFLSKGLGAAGLFTANVVCINLAGVLTFLYQGLRPTHGGKKKRPDGPRSEPSPYGRDCWSP
jgi:uncharacterized hydrophobic protein (TIGR00341 family)